MIALALSESAERKAQLFALLARQLSYPNASEAVALISTNNVVELCDWATELLPRSAILRPEREALLKAASDDEHATACAAALRECHTILFDLPSSPAVPYGHVWVAPKTLAARQYGEAYAVRQYLERFGLRTRMGEYSPDHIVCELELLSFIFQSQAIDWKTGASAAARNISAIAEEFMANHFNEFVEKFSAKLEACSSHPLYTITATVLRSARNA